MKRVKNQRKAGQAQEGKRVKNRRTAVKRRVMKGVKQRRKAGQEGRPSGSKRGGGKRIKRRRKVKKRRKRGQAGKRTGWEKEKQGGSGNGTKKIFIFVANTVLMAKN